jgi:hypothetical protein
MLFSRFAQAAALLLLTIGFAAPVHAQNNKQIISGTWYEDRANTTFSGTSLNLGFTQTPTNQFLNVTNVSCVVIINSTQAPITINLNAGTVYQAFDLGRPYSIVGGATMETSGSSKIYSIDTNQVFYKFGPGRFPTIVISTSVGASVTFTAQCVIVGNLTDN